MIPQARLVPRAAAPAQAAVPALVAALAAAIISLVALAARLAAAHLALPLPALLPALLPAPLQAHPPQVPLQALAAPMIMMELHRLAVSQGVVQGPIMTEIPRILPALIRATAAPALVPAPAAVLVQAVHHPHRPAALQAHLRPAVVVAAAHQAPLALAAVALALAPLRAVIKWYIGCTNKI